MTQSRVVSSRREDGRDGVQNGPVIPLNDETIEPHVHCKHLGFPASKHFGLLTVSHCWAFC